MIEINYDSLQEKNYIFKKTRQDEIIQNIENILSRIKGNIPINREKGIDTSLVDDPFNTVNIYMTGIIMDEIERDEKRFDVIEVNYDNSKQLEGKVIITVKGVILDE